MPHLRSRILTVFSAFLSLTLCLFVLSCRAGVGSTKEKTSLEISFALAKEGAKTLTPPLDMTPASYNVVASGPGGQQASATTSGQSVLLDGLSGGEWDVDATALNQAGTVIGEGRAQALLVADIRNELTLSVEPLPGTGTLALTVQWLVSAAPTPSLVASLDPPQGDSLPLDFSIDGTTGTCSKEGIAVGYYTLHLQLLNGGNVVAGTTDVVRILKDQTTTGTFDFTKDDDGTGSLSVTILPDLQDPLLLDVAGKQAELGLGRSLTLKPWTTEEQPLLTPAWYVDGALRSSETVATLGADLALGVHRIDLAAFTPDGSRGGSSGFKVRVVSPFPPGSLSLSNLIVDGQSGVDGLNACRTARLSSDGKFLYAEGYGDSSIALFTRDPDTGALRFRLRYKDKTGSIVGLSGVESVAITPDGRYLFAAGSSEGTLAAFSRSASTGELTFLSCIRSSDSGCEGLAGARSIALSPDGKNLYSTGYTNGSLLVFGLNTSTGELTLLQSLTDEQNGVTTLGGASAVVVTPDGSQVLVASYTDDSLTGFRRDQDTGLLTLDTSFLDGQAGCDGLNGADGIAFSPDGTSVYVASYFDNALACFSRDPSTGALSFQGFFKDGVGGVDGLYYARGVAVSADGTSVYVCGSADDAVAFFSRNVVTGTLSFEAAAAGMDGARGVALSPDGKNCYVGCTNANALAILNRSP